MIAADWVDDEEAEEEEDLTPFEVLKSGQNMIAADWVDDEEEEEEEDLTPFEVLKSGQNIIAADWVSRAKSLYLSQKGREPTVAELESTIREFAMEMADSVLNVNEVAEESVSEDEVDGEEVDVLNSIDIDIDSEEERGGLFDG